ncbi:MAG: serine/threonine protein phosphatase [Planctomycetia bacterium]|nr:serine/threonine protein phosphatase [Planctomycetia bacterium]
MDEPISVTAGGVHWLIRPDCQHLLGPDGLRLQEWLQAGQAQVVKHGPHRTVYRVALPGLDVHVKHYRLMDLRAWLRELLRPAKALAEYRRALAVAARQVPTFAPVAVGRKQDRLGASDSYLITRSLDGTSTLADYLEKELPALPAARQTQQRQQLAVELGRFLARLHVQGVIHDDLHAGNILVRQEPDDALWLYLIDLHAIRVGQPLGWRARVANLVLLNRYFSIRSSRADRMRFWHAYFRAAQPQAEPHRKRLLAQQLELQTWKSDLRFWRQRDGRALESNRYYQRVRSAVAVGHAVRDLDPATLAELLTNPDAPFARTEVKLLKDSRSSTVAELLIPVHGEPRAVIYKRFRITSWTDPFTALARPTAALRSWVMGHGFRERDLPTARPLLVLHRRRHGLLHEGYLLMEKVENAHDLHAFVQQLAGRPSAERSAILRQLVERTARLILELHRRHLAHRDLKATNLLVGPRLDLTFIDLVGVSRHGNLSERRKQHNLARLHVSFCQNPLLTRTEKLRFLRTYLQWGLFGKQGWKAWWRRIAALTQAKLERNRRSGRPIG